MCSDSPLQPRRPYNRDNSENPDNLDHGFSDERRGIVKEIERSGLGSDVDDDGLSTVEVEAGLALSTEGD